jgi:hypothetical protein
METNNPSNQEQQGNSLSGVTGNEESNEATYSSADDAANQEDYPDNGNESQTGAATGNDGLETDDDDNLDDDDDLADIDEDVTEDESANDTDGNGGYPDEIETNS